MKTRLQAKLGFTLVEIVLALGVASVFLVGIVSLLSTGLTSSREAANDTRLSLIVRDVNNRLRGAPLVPSTDLIPPLFYTADGEWIDPAAAPATPPLRPFFGIRTKGVTPNPAPDNSNVLGVIIEAYYPVSVDGGGIPQIPTGATPKTKFTYYATTAAGNGWSVIDPSFVPKIEL